MQPLTLTITQHNTFFRNDSAILERARHEVEMCREHDMLAALP
jgi:hypothetical protein